MRFLDGLLLYQVGHGRHKHYTRNTTATVTDAGGGTTSGGDAGGGGTQTPPAAVTPPSGTTTVTPPADGSSTVTPADDIKDGDWRTLRTKYDTAKTRAAILDNLGLPDTELTGAVGVFKAIHTEVTTLAKELGYTDEADVKAAFEKDPAGILAVLRKEKAEKAAQTQVPQRTGETTVDYDKRIADEVAKQTKPYTEHINKQISDAVTAKIGTEFHTAFTTALPDAPQTLRDLVEDYVTEHLVGNTDALVAMKTKGDYAAVSDAVKMVAGRLKSVFADWVKSESKRSGNSRMTADPTTGLPVTKRPTLDDMINDPGLINEKYR